MRILTVSNCPLLESQGSGYVTSNYCNGLRQLGHVIDAFGPDAYEVYPHWQGRAKSYRQAIGMLPFTLKQLKRQRYDILEFYGAEAWLTITVLRQLPQRNFLIVSHSNGLETHFLNTLIEYSALGTIEHPYAKWYQINQTSLFRLAFTGADALVTVSYHDYRYALAQHYQEEPHLLRIDNPLPANFLGLEISVDRPQVIGFCGSWLAGKGTRVIQTDITRILQEFPDWSLQLIGVGQDFKAHDHFPNDVCDRIRVVPFVSDKQKLQKLYQQIAILILPSVFESFGLVVTEGMACGCAIVTTRTGFAASLHDQQDALLLDKAISPQLYHSVRRLICDQSLRHQIAINGYQRVQQLQWPQAIDTLESTYQTWLTQFRQQ